MDFDLIGMSIGKKIRLMRIQQNMTQKELGERLGGISQQQIGRWENGKVNPKINTIQKIAAILNVDINDLLESPLDDSPIFRALKNSDSTDSVFSQKEFINRKLTKQIEDWQQIDIELIKKFKKLNTVGKSVAIERVEELAEIPRYADKTEHLPNTPDQIIP